MTRMRCVLGAMCRVTMFPCCMYVCMYVKIRRHQHSVRAFVNMVENWQRKDRERKRRLRSQSFAVCRVCTAGSGSNSSRSFDV